MRISGGTGHIQPTLETPLPYVDYRYRVPVQLYEYHCTIQQYGSFGILELYSTYEYCVH